MRAKLIALLSPQMKRQLKSWIYKLKLGFAACFSRLPILSGFYYFVLSSAFRREQFAVLKGRLAFDKRNVALSTSSSMLRRNIHRLEKGLIMQPRRAIFAEDYILETVEELKATANALQAEERLWAFQVLQKYFNVVVDFGDIPAARHIFSGCTSLIESVEPFSPAVPYTYESLPESLLSYDQLLRLYQRRRSVRWFLPDSVPQSLLEQAVQAAALAPSACNRQPFQFIQLEGADAATVAGFAMGTTGFAQQIPTLLVVLGDLSAYPAERDRHVIYIDGALAGMQLMLALDTLGLASCPINWPDVEVLERKMDAYLKLQPWQRPVMLIAIGYPDPTGGIAYSAKKTVGQLLVPFRSRSVDNSAHKSADKKESSC